MSQNAQTNLMAVSFSFSCRLLSNKRTLMATNYITNTVSFFTYCLLVTSLLHLLYGTHFLPTSEHAHFMVLLAVSWKAFILMMLC